MSTMLPMIAYQALKTNMENHDFLTAANRFENTRGQIRVYSHTYVILPLEQNITTQDVTVNIPTIGDVVIPGQTVTLPYPEMQYVFQPFAIADKQMVLQEAWYRFNHHDTIASILDPSLSVPDYLELRVHRGGDTVWPLSNDPGGDIMGGGFMFGTNRNLCFNSSFQLPILKEGTTLNALTPNIRYTGLYDPRLIGDFNASLGVFPGNETALAGSYFEVTVAGVVDGVSFSVGEGLIASIDEPSSTTFSGNWTKTSGPRPETPTRRVVYPGEAFGAYAWWDGAQPAGEEPFHSLTVSMKFLIV